MDRNSLNAADVRCGPEQSIARVTESSRHQRCGQKRSVPIGSHTWRLKALSRLACRFSICVIGRAVAILTIFRLALLYSTHGKWCYKVVKLVDCVTAWLRSGRRRFNRSTICAAESCLNASHTPRVTKQSTKTLLNNSASATAMFATSIVGGGAP